VLLLLGGLIAWQIQGYSRRVAELQTESKNLDNPVKAAEQLRAEVAVIDAFAAGDVNWLDELYGLSQKFPNADEALVDVVTFSTRTEGGGLVYLEGYVRDPAIIEKMESKLRDARRQVTGSGTTFDERQPEYRWQFKERIVILPPEQEEAVDE
jgi:hypothetical protein